MSFPNTIYGSEGQQFGTETHDAGVPIGTKMVFSSGTSYRWANIGATLLVVARLNQGPAIAAPFGTDEAPTVIAAAGATTVTIDATTALALDDLKGGALIDETNGHSYVLSGNTAADPTVVTLESPSGLITDLGVSDLVRFYKSPFKDVVVKVAGTTSVLAGFTEHIIPAVQWGWVKTRGFTPVLVDGTLIIGDPARASFDDIGAVAAETGAIGQNAGVVYNIGSDTNVDGDIFATIDN